MTRIDFYILENGPAEYRHVTACRLTDKAFSLDNTIYIHTESQEQANHMDNLLWTFRAGSFLPHHIHGSSAATQGELPPILIGHNAEPEEHNQVLINLDHSVPMFFSRFERVAEIIANDEQSKQQGRERFKFYRERGYELKTHSLTV